MSDQISVDVMASEIKSLLPVEILLITFEKQDGSIRELYGTLMPEFLPEREPDSEEKSPRKKNPDVQIVFDLQKQEFRLFRKDSIRSWEIVDEVPELADTA